MISIRAQLLWSLLPAFIAINIVAGFGVYLSTKAELEARLDTRLATLAFELKFTDRGPDRREKRSRRRTLREITSDRPQYSPRLQNSIFTNLPENVYCEITDNGPNKNLKTDNLNEAAIPQPDQFKETPTFYDATLNNTTTLRAWAARLTLTPTPNPPKVILAIDRAEEDVTLYRLAWNLLFVITIISTLFGGILIIVLRISLKPLQKLGEHAAAMDAELLHERFATESAPADIRPIIERLNSLMAKLEESFARERRFSGDLAHELRTPLAAIRTTSEVAIKWPDQSSAEDFEEILTLSTSLQQTLDSLLLLARMESSTAEKNCETVNLAKIAEECRALHTARAQERGLSFLTNLDAGATLETDPRLARVILTNLIGNAVEYAPEGSVVSITAGGDAIFECGNEAPLLALDDVPRLFERMWRKDAARTESGHAGLGLSIAKACADALQLELAAKLSDAQHLTFSLRIP